MGFPGSNKFQISYQRAEETKNVVAHEWIILNDDDRAKSRIIASSAKKEHKIN